MRNFFARLREIGAAYIEPLKVTGEAVADLGRWALDKAKVVVQKAKDISPVAVVRKGSLTYTSWPDDIIEGGTD